MEARLNAQIKGQSFNIVDCYRYLKLLRKTKALSSKFSILRKSSLDMLQRKIDMELSRITETTDSIVGTVIEESNIAKDISDAASDDVARARHIIDSGGVKSSVPGITSSLF